jgi:hypothetical protein
MRQELLYRQVVIADLCKMIRNNTK